MGGDDGVGFTRTFRMGRRFATMSPPRLRRFGRVGIYIPRRIGKFQIARNGDRFHYGLVVPILRFGYGRVPPETCFPDRAKNDSRFQICIFQFLRSTHKWVSMFGVWRLVDSDLKSLRKIKYVTLEMWL